MSYSQGGLIAASDYNGFVGTATTSSTINYVWSTGNGQFGYGQSALSQAATTAGLVTAAQWATAINTLDNILTHQTGSGSSNVALPTAGTLITYLSAISSDITTINTNKLNFGTQGATVTGTTFSPPETVANTNVAVTFSTVRSATFASADQARYFFNAGGQLNFVISSVTNNDGTARSGDLVTLLQGNLGGITAFRALTNGGRTGSGGTVNTNLTNIGYYGLTTSNVTIQQITSTTSGYTSDYVNVAVKTNGVQGSNADNGSVISFALNMYSNSRTPITAPTWGGAGVPPTVNIVVNDSINITVNHRIDVVYPELTNLTSNTWGAVTIT